MSRLVLELFETSNYDYTYFFYLKEKKTKGMVGDEDELIDLDEDEVKK